jgi:hypothetical protein
MHDKLSLYSTPKQCFRIQNSAVNNATCLNVSQNKYHILAHKAVPYSHMIKIWLYLAVCQQSHLRKSKQRE